jgi:hypothetical protein
VQKTDESVVGENLVTSATEKQTSSAGFIKFYGLYWKRASLSQGLCGVPSGWIGKGKISPEFDRSNLKMDFSGQKGVYILYDDSLNPVYAGQAGISRSNATSGGQTIGNRLLAHSTGPYRNGWSLFSWFGFLKTNKLSLKSANLEARMKPVWTYENVDSPESESDQLNDLLASFEAILIEGFAPRFNARGGDLKGALYVNQYEENSG